MMREINEAHLCAALGTVIEHAQGVALSAERVRQLGRVSLGARDALEAISLPTLFDTEPADLYTLLEHIEEASR